MCGREIVSKPGRAVVEGAALIVCQQCSSIGTKLPGFPDRPRRPVIAPSHTHAPIERLPYAVEESDLIEEYSRVIKEGREKLGISQQNLAFKAKETLTVIQKTEMGKMLSTMRLSKALEHILRVRLLVPREELDLPSPPRKASQPPIVTLGDVALVKHKQDIDE